MRPTLITPQEIPRSEMLPPYLVPMRASIGPLQNPQIIYQRIQVAESCLGKIEIEENSPFQEAVFLVYLKSYERPDLNDIFKSLIEIKGFDRYKYQYCATSQYLVFAKTN